MLLRPTRPLALLTWCSCFDGSGYIRQRGVNVNGLLHVPGAGDFQMDRIDGLSELQPSQSSAGPHQHSSDGEAPAHTPANLEMWLMQVMRVLCCHSDAREAAC